MVQGNRTGTEEVKRSRSIPPFILCLIIFFLLNISFLTSSTFLHCLSINNLLSLR